MPFTIPDSDEGGNDIQSVMLQKYLAADQIQMNFGTAKSL
jgi:hypothetical protein